MLLERIYDEDLAQASYLIGCQAKGEAIVVDARRDIAVYKDIAKANDMKIFAVTETHIYADYLSGEGGEDWQYRFEGKRLMDGDSIKPGFMLTGDFVFVGDLGRPDLLDEAAGGVDTRFGGAHDLFVSVKKKFLPLPDYVQVHPAHGSGSACGKALGAIPSTTVGYEGNFAWWAPFLAVDDEAGFVEARSTGSRTRTHTSVA